MALLLFNPENDLALADNGANYMPPPAAQRIAEDLSLLPLWYGSTKDKVWSGATSPSNLLDQLPPFIDLQQITSTPSAKTEVEPWGWSLQARMRLLRAGIEAERLPSPEQIAHHRNLSHRASSIALLQAIQQADLLHHHITLPRLLHTPEEVEEALAKEPILLFKAGWSGSGKGLYRSRGQHEIALERWTRGVIHRQGSVVVERLYEKKIDFAVELRIEKGRPHFIGYSLFQTDIKGCYIGNQLMSDAAIEEHLSAYIDIAQLHTTINLLCQELSAPPVPIQSGYIGIDMMVIRTPNRTWALHPCVEINRRTNMGVVAHQLRQKYLCRERQGIFNIDYFATNQALIEDDNRRRNQQPLRIVGDKIDEGYLSLCPITPESRYRARIEVWR